MSLIKKLRLQESEVFILKLPDAVKDSFVGVDYKKTLSGRGNIDQVVLFAKDIKALEDHMPKLLPRLTNEALLWVAYPKKSGSIKSDITRDTGWDALMGKGYDPVMQIAVNEDWSALRFKKTELIGPKLRDIPMTERKIEGIDFVNRKVTLPKDAVEALKPYKELSALFKQMSFSHQKEHVEAIVTAKKPETRARRINKMIEMLEQYLASKKK